MTDRCTPQPADPQIGHSGTAGACRLGSSCRPVECHASRYLAIAPGQPVADRVAEALDGPGLPELENISLEAALRIAVDRHEHTTGSMVNSRYSGLPNRTPHPLKICLYRVVQEGLNNAFQHAAGRDQRVIAIADEKFITIVISDGGPGVTQTPPSKPHGRPLGLQGIRNRVEAFGGWVQIRKRGKAGTQLVARVPMENNSA